MRIHIHHTHRTPEQAEVLDAVAKGLQRLGEAVFVFSPGAEYRPCDVLVVYGLLKWKWHTDHTGTTSHALNLGKTCTVAGALRVWQGTGRPSLATENSDLKAKLFEAHPKPWRVLVVERGVSPGMYALGWGGIIGHAFKEATVPHLLAPPKRFAAAEVRMLPWRGRGPYTLDSDRKSFGPVIVCGQVPWDVTTQDTDHMAWVREQVQRARGFGYAVEFRPHPNITDRRLVLPWNVDCPVSTNPLGLDLGRASAFVTYNSTVAVDAVMAGVPTVATDREGSMASRVTSPAMDVRGDFLAYTPDRTQWAQGLAYTQWTPAEIADGTAWKDVVEAMPEPLADAVQADEVPY